MARVEIASMPWGVLQDRHGESQNGTSATLKNLDGSNATTWSAVTGGSSSTASLTADANGNLPRFVEGGQYTLDVPALGVSGRRVEAVSGSVESRSVYVPAQSAVAANGTTDDTVAIQALIDASPEETIFDFGSPEHSYKVGSLIPKTGHTYLGNGARLIQKTGETEAVIYHSQASASVSHITVKGIRFEGAGQAESPVVRQAAVRIDRGTDIRVEGCHVSGFADSGILLVGVIRGYVINNIVKDCCSASSRNAIHVAPYGSSTELTHGEIVVSGNIVQAIATAGICIQSFYDVRQRVTVTGNVIRDCTGFAGIALEANDFLEDVVVSGNVIVGCLAGVSAKDTSGASGATDPEQLRQFVIANNLIDADTLTAGVGMDLSISQAVVSNNVIRAKSFAFLAYGETATTPDRRIHGLLITGNVVSCANTGTVPHIVQLTFADYCTIQGNHISLETGASSASGIKTSDTTGVNVLGNTIVGVSRNGIEAADHKDGAICNNVVINPNAENAGYNGIRASGATNKCLAITGNVCIDQRSSPQMAYGIELASITAANLVRTRANTVHGSVTRDVSTATVANVSLGGSPHTFQNTDGHDMDVIVQGGTVSSVDVSRDNSNWYATGATAGLFHVGPNEYLRVTYSVAPTVRRVPRPG